MVHSGDVQLKLTATFEQKYVLYNTMYVNVSEQIHAEASRGAKNGSEISHHAPGLLLVFYRPHHLPVYVCEIAFPAMVWLSAFVCLIPNW